MGQTHLHGLKHYHVPGAKENGKNCICVDTDKSGEKTNNRYSLYYFLSDTGKEAVPSSGWCQQALVNSMKRSNCQAGSFCYYLIIIPESFKKPT